MLLLALPPSPCPTDTSRRPHRELSVVLDNRNSFLRESAVKIIGLNVGVKLNPRWRLGLGAYTLRRDYAEQFLYNKSRKVTARLAPDLSLTYLTPNLTWTFWWRHYFEVSVPLDVGLGRSHYTLYNETKNVVVQERRGLFVPAEIGLGVLLKPTRWVGLSGLAGYRKSVLEIDFKDDFDGWYYGYRLNLFVGNLWADWRRYRRAHPRPPYDAPPPGVE